MTHHDCAAPLADEWLSSVWYVVCGVCVVGLCGEGAVLTWGNEPYDLDLYVVPVNVVSFDKKAAKWKQMFGQVSLSRSSSSCSVVRRLLCYVLRCCVCSFLRQTAICLRAVVEGAATATASYVACLVRMLFLLRDSLLQAGCRRLSETASFCLCLRFLCR
jgi:hypothetical protein